MSDMPVKMQSMRRGVNHAGARPASLTSDIVPSTKTEATQSLSRFYTWVALASLQRQLQAWTADSATPSAGPRPKTSGSTRIP